MEQLTIPKRKAHNKKIIIIGQNLNSIKWHFELPVVT